MGRLRPVSIVFVALELFVPSAASAEKRYTADSFLAEYKPHQEALKQVYSQCMMECTVKSSADGPTLAPERPILYRGYALQEQRRVDVIRGNGSQSSWANNPLDAFSADRTDANARFKLAAVYPKDERPRAYNFCPMLDAPHRVHGVRVEDIVREKPDDAYRKPIKLISIVENDGLVRIDYQWGGRSCWMTLDRDRSFALTRFAGEFPIRPLKYDVQLEYDRIHAGVPLVARRFVTEVESEGSLHNETWLDWTVTSFDVNAPSARRFTRADFGLDERQPLAWYFRLLIIGAIVLGGTALYRRWRSR